MRQRQLWTGGAGDEAVDAVAEGCGGAHGCGSRTSVSAIAEADDGRNARHSAGDGLLGRHGEIL
jgi:hypothetical protein